MPDKTRIVGNLVSDNNIFVNVATDNTGIGTTNPSYKLSVVGNANVTGFVTASTYYGDAGNLSNIRTSYRFNNSVVGSATTLNIIGSGVSSVTLSNDTVTVNVPGTTRTVNLYTATLNQTTFNATYTPGFVDVFLNGVKLSQDQYTATDGLTIVLETGASLGDIIEIVGYSTYRVVATQIILTDVVSSSSGISTSYTGIADQGSSQSASVWLIRRAVFDNSGTLTGAGTTTNEAWINRYTASYV